MTPRQRGLLLAVAVAVLLPINLWQWWPADDVGPGRPGGALQQLPDALDLTLAGQESAVSQPFSIQRDLFQPVRPRPQPQAVAEPPPSPRETPADSAAQQRVMADLEAFRLVGILFHNGQRRAYLIRAEENFSVSRGERIAGHYVIDEITTTSVTLRDTRNRVTRKVELQ